MRVLFFGYSSMGAAALEVLLRRGDEIAAVVTHRDDPQEDRWFETPAEKAREAGLEAPLLFGEEMGREELLDLARRSAPDLVLSVFYRSLLPGAVLEAARRAALNLHPSLLPAYRGRAPINWVLVRGEKETGITLHHMTERADAGDIVAQRRVEIAPRETALSLYRKLEREGVALLEETLPLVERGEAPRIPQDEEKAFYVGRRRPEDGWIDWARPVWEIDCLVRAVAPPWPGAFAELDLGKGPVVLRIEEGEPSFGKAGEPLPPPGTVRAEGGGLLVAAGDGWFRVKRWSEVENPPGRKG